MDKNMLLSEQENIVQQFSCYAEVVLDRHTSGSLLYGVPDHLKVEKGHLVEVFLRNSLEQGIVIELHANSKLSKIRPIESICCSIKWISEDLFKLAHWMSRSYCSSLQYCIWLICPTHTRILKDDIKRKSLPDFIGRKITRPKLIIWCQEHRHKKPAQSRILDLFIKGKRAQATEDILATAKTSYSVLKTLLKQNILEEIKIPSESELMQMFPFVKQSPKSLSSQQHDIFNKILETFSDYKKPHLLWGITGSGKTEIYIRLVKKVISEGKQALLLIPEIALIGQIVEYFHSQIDESIVIYHSGLDDRVKSKARQMMLEGNAKVVIGTRSAIFSPLPNLGIILIDEEHDMSYKNEYGICFHARDIAKQRSLFSKCPLVLGSATPSFESLYSAFNETYYLHRMEHKISKRKPTIELVPYPKKGIFSSSLLQALANTEERNEQAILLLNRKGFYSLAICQKCNKPIQCPSCDIALTVYVHKKLFLCHFCQYSTPFIEKTCPECNSPLLKFLGYGTERAEMILNNLMPSLKIIRIDRDLLTKKAALDEQLHLFRSGKANVLLGTQMIAKGHHFPNVSLIGILNPDQHLWNPDFRNSEYLVQLLTQVTGRVSRESLPGKVILQTQTPDLSYYSYALKEEYETFYKEELLHRKTFNYPPFCSLIRIVFSHISMTKVVLFAENFRVAMGKILDTNDLVSPCSPLHRYKLANYFRIHFVIKTHNWEKCSLNINTLLQQNIVPRNCIRVDFHPTVLS